MVEGCLHNLLLQVSVKIACKSVTLELFHMVSNGLKCCNRLGIVNSKIRRAPVRGGKSGVVNVSDYHYFTHIYRDLYLCSNLTPKYKFLLRLTKLKVFSPHSLNCVKNNPDSIKTLAWFVSSYFAIFL